jgi:hypothetical protein
VIAYEYARVKRFVGAEIDYPRDSRQHLGGRLYLVKQVTSNHNLVTTNLAYLLKSRFQAIKRLTASTIQAGFDRPAKSSMRVYVAIRDEGQFHGLASRSAAYWRKYRPNLPLRQGTPDDRQMSFSNKIISANGKSKALLCAVHQPAVMVFPFRSTTWPP